MRRGLFPLLAVLAAGCGGDGPSGGPDKPVGKIDLTPTSVADLDKAIASHKGKVVLIDCWFLG